MDYLKQDISIGLMIKQSTTDRDKWVSSREIFILGWHMSSFYKQLHLPYQLFYGYKSHSLFYLNSIDYSR